MGEPKLFTETEARQLLAKVCATRPTMTAWAIDHDQHPTFVSEMISGRKPLSRRICAILGLKKVTRFEVFDVDERTKLR